MECYRESPEYRQAIEFLFGRINYERTASMPAGGRDLNLTRMRRLLELLGDPHERLRVVHIAGTKGKGSTATLVAAALSAAGYRTGLHTSPHLHHVEERLVVDGKACTPETMAALVQTARPAVAWLDREFGQDGRTAGPTYFEITTALTLLYFAQSQVDLAVVEVGLGGRLDSTNVCHPLVTVITSISFDHTRQLGNTLALIAREKAGIIKPNVPVVSGAIHPEAAEVIQRVAEDQNSPLSVLDQQFRFTYRAPGEDSTQLNSHVCYEERADGGAWEFVFRQLQLGLLGRHQAENAAIALAAVRQLPPPWQVSEDSIRQAFAAARCPARIEIVSHHPVTIVDVAHNVASAMALMQVIAECFPRTRRTLVLAATRGKDVPGILRVLLPGFDSVVCTRYVSNPRAMNPVELCEIARRVAREENCLSAGSHSLFRRFRGSLANRESSEVAQRLNLRDRFFLYRGGSKGAAARAGDVRHAGTLVGQLHFCL